jgi:hypothetical protein
MSKVRTSLRSKESQQIREFLLFPGRQLAPVRNTGDTVCPPDRTGSATPRQITPISGDPRIGIPVALLEQLTSVEAVRAAATVKEASMRRVAIALFPLALVALLLVPVRAEAITLREIIELTRAGLGEEVLLALIEVDQRVFPTDPETLRMLKQAGVSDRVIVAIVRSGRIPQAVPETMPETMVVPQAAPPEPAAPQVIFIERERPVVQQIAVPVYVPVVRASRSDHRHVDDHDRRHIEHRKRAEPVYWGWGGKRRPDAWDSGPFETKAEPVRPKR